MDVYKAGGTSNESRAALEAYSSFLLENSNQKVTVQSAIAGVTNLLLTGAAEQVWTGIFPKHIKEELETKTRTVYGEIPGAEDVIDRLLQELDDDTRPRNPIEREEDQKTHTARVASWGERASAHLFTYFLDQKGVKAKYVDSRNCMFLVGDPTNAEYSRNSDNHIREQTKNSRIDVFVFGGYWGINLLTRDEMVFDRGGSDYTQTIIMRALRSKRGYNCTDVNGILPVDPRILSVEERSALNTIPELAYEEMQELARKGAKVLHPRCIEPLMEHRAELYVVNTFDSQGARSRIAPLDQRQPARITAVTGKKENYITVTLRTGTMEGQTGFFTGVAGAFEGTNIETVTTSQVGISVSFSDPTANLDQIVQKLSCLGHVAPHNGSSMVAMVGRKLGEKPALLARFFHTLAESSIPVGQITKSDEFSVWVSIPIESYELALRSLYHNLIQQGERP